MNQRRITIITQGEGDIIIEFQELKNHHFKLIYYMITETQELAQLGQAFYDWCNGVGAETFDLDGLKVSEND